MKLRSFVSVEVGPGARLELARLADEMAREFPRAKVNWVAPEQHHITLCFLGSVDEERLDDIGDRLDRQLGQVAGVDLTLGSPGRFSSVLWVGLDGGSEALREVQARVARLCRGAGVAIEDRSFEPHVTLARLKKGARSFPRELRERWEAMKPHPVEWRVSGVDLMRSELSPQGARYHLLGRTILG